MRPVYAEWSEHRHDRPWIAYFHRISRLVKWPTWLASISISAVVVLSGISSKHAGSLFSDEVPTWVSKVPVAVLFGFLSTVTVASLTRKVRPNEPEINAPVAWTKVDLTIKNWFRSTLLDWGYSSIGNGRLTFRGFHCSFEFDLARTEISEVEPDERCITLWIPKSRQRLLMRFQPGNDLESFLTKVTKAIDADPRQHQSDVFPPKPLDHSWLLVLPTMAMVMVGLDLWVTACWQVSALLPFWRPGAFLLIGLVSSVAIISAILAANLRWWKSRYRRRAEPIPNEQKSG